MKIVVCVGIKYNTTMMKPQIVLDTNVLIAAQRSKRGASSRLVSLLGTGRFDTHISVALALEYEDVLLRYRVELGLTADDVGGLVDSLCSLSTPHAIYYQWHPLLRDAGDELVLELAIAAGCSHIVSFNRRNFVGAERFHIRVVTPGEFLKEIGKTS